MIGCRARTFDRLGRIYPDDDDQKRTDRDLPLAVLEPRYRSRRADAGAPPRHITCIAQNRRFQ